MSDEAFLPGTRVEYIAILTCMGLWGISCMQTFLYFVNYHRIDRWHIQAVVVILWALDTAHQIGTFQGFWVLISRIHDPFALSKEYLWAGLLTSMVTVMTQAFFVLRIWKFSNRHWAVLLFFGPCTLFQLGGYIGLIVSVQGGSTAGAILAVAKLPMAFWAVQAAEDILISAALIYLLWRRRLSIGLKGTERLLYRLTIFVINTGIWTSLCALFTVITLVLYPDFQAFLALSLVMCPLYCNTLLANLNARKFIRGPDASLVDYSITSRRTPRFASTFRTTRPEFSSESYGEDVQPRAEVLELSIPTHTSSSSHKAREVETESSVPYVVDMPASGAEAV